MIPLIGEASSGQFGVNFYGVSLSPGFVRLSSGFFAFDGDGVHDLIRLEFDKLAKIQDTYKLVGYVSQNSHLLN